VSMEEVKKIWACWKIGAGGPNYQHENKDLAMAEAARIASKTGSVVLVLEAVGFVEPLTSPTKYTQL
jgi:hypothetical protein